MARFHPRAALAAAAATVATTLIAFGALGLVRPAEAQFGGGAAAGAANQLADGWGGPAPAAGRPADRRDRLDWQILENPGGPHWVVVVDPERQVLAVYQVDQATGEIILKSVRSVSDDLRLKQHNTSKPTPREVRAMLDESP